MLKMTNFAKHNVAAHKSGFVDWITISSNLLFVMNYATNFEDFAKNTFYNRVRVIDYDVTGYLEGVEIVSMDYRRWKKEDRRRKMFHPRYWYR